MTNEDRRQITGESQIARFNSVNSEIRHTGRKFTKFGHDVTWLLPLNFLKAYLWSANPLLNAEAKSKFVPCNVCKHLPYLTGCHDILRGSGVRQSCVFRTSDWLIRLRFKFGMPPSESATSSDGRTPRRQVCGVHGQDHSGSAIAEGPRDALVSRNSATYKTSHLKNRVSGLSCGIICRRMDRRTDRHTTTACTALSIASRGKNRL